MYLAYVCDRFYHYALIAVNDMNDIDSKEFLLLDYGEEKEMRMKYTINN